MTISEMLGQSLILTLLGMGVVFCFLIILIGVMHFLHFIVAALNLEKSKDKTTQKSSAVPVSNPTVPAGSNEAVIAAIAAAVHEKQ
ncbi:MAG: OadG family protein [Treponema sp.]|jgi:oxaloacetate decarboxylase gamma subunit|nr:OadG family protein [Treponema sp.]